MCCKAFHSTREQFSLGLGTTASQNLNSTCLHIKRVMLGELENVGKRGPGGERERVDGLRGRLSSAIWYHGGLEHRRT